MTGTGRLCQVHHKLSVGFTIHGIPRQIPRSSPGNHFPIPVVTGAVAGAEKTLPAFFNDASQVRAYGRKGPDPFVIPVNVQLPLGHVCEGIQGKIIQVSDPVFFPIGTAARNKLAEQTG